MVKDMRTKEAENGEKSADLPPNRLQPIAIDPQMISEWIHREDIEADEALSVAKPSKKPAPSESPKQASPWVAPERLDKALLPSAHAPRGASDGRGDTAGGEGGQEVRRLRGWLLLAIGVGILALGTAIAALIVRTTPEEPGPKPAETGNKPAPSAIPDAKPEPISTVIPSAAPLRTPSKVNTAAPLRQPPAAVPKAPSKLPNSPQEGEAVF